MILLPRGEHAHASVGMAPVNRAINDMLNDGSKSRNVLPRRIIVAGAAVLLMVWITFSKRDERPGKTTANPPSERISALIDACRSGDVEGYLDCFTGDLRSHLGSKADSKSPTAFATSVREQVADLQSVVTLDAKPQGTDRMQLVVERVYVDFNERQRVTLRQVGTSWKIETLGELRRYAPEIPYGTPATGPMSPVEKTANESGPQEAVDE